MVRYLLSILVSGLVLFANPLSACSVHDHNCAFHGIGRAVNQTIDQNSPTSVVIGTIGSNDVDFDNHVLLPDGNGPYIVSSAGFTPRSDQPYIDPTQQPRHLYPTQFQIDFQNSSAQATYSGDVTGGVVIPGAQPCTIGTAQYCEEVRIIGNIPDPGTPEGFVVRQTNHLYNFPNTPNPSIDLISYGVATGRAYFKRQSHLGYSETIDYNGQTLQLAGIRQETLSGTGDQGREQTYYIGYNDFDAHAAGVVVHNDQKKLIGTDVYAVQFGHQKTPNGDIFKYDGLQRKNTYIKYDRTYDFTKYARADTGLPALEMTNNETARWNTWSNYYAAQHTKEYTKYQNDLEAQRVLDREKFERDIARGCLDSICSNLSGKSAWAGMNQSKVIIRPQRLSFDGNPNVTFNPETYRFYAGDGASIKDKSFVMFMNVGDRAIDTNAKYKVTTRTIGLGQTVLGGVGAVGSAGLCTTGLGCVVGGAGIVVGLDNVRSGWSTVLRGEYQVTLGEQAIYHTGEYVGLEEETIDKSVLTYNVGATVFNLGNSVRLFRSIDDIAEGGGELVHSSNFDTDIDLSSQKTVVKLDEPLNNGGFHNTELQGGADSIQSQLSGPAANLRVTTVTQTQDGRVIVSTTGGLPTPAQRAEARRIFGDDVEFVSGGTTTNASGSTGHHAEQRGIESLGDDATGATQASSHFSCDGCAFAQSNANVTNVTGNAIDNGGQIGRPLDPSQAPNTE